jgi:hypothetical protein
VKVGSLVRRTRHSHHKIGVVLQVAQLGGRQSLYVRWFELDPSEERHGWFSRGELKVIV